MSGTELLNISHYIDGERVINTLVSCIINKTRKLVLWNRKFAFGYMGAATVRRKFGTLYLETLKKDGTMAQVQISN